mgnify:CR=1 FL=1
MSSLRLFSTELLPAPLMPDLASIIIESISSETKLKTKNPLSALNSFSKRNCSPRSDLTRNVTSRNVILESKSIKEIEIC